VGAFFLLSFIQLAPSYARLPQLVVVSDFALHKPIVLVKIFPNFLV